MKKVSELTDQELIETARICGGCEGCEGCPFEADQSTCTDQVLIELARRFGTASDEIKQLKSDFSQIGKENDFLRKQVDALRECFREEATAKRRLKAESAQLEADLALARSRMSELLDQLHKAETSKDTCVSAKHITPCRMISYAELCRLMAEEYRIYHNCVTCGVRHCVKRPINVAPSHCVCSAWKPE